MSQPSAPPAPAPAAPPPEPAFAAYVGIDWADQQHVVCLQAAGSAEVQTTPLDQTPEALEAWALGLRERFGGRPIAVCLEQARGALLFALLKYAFLCLYPLPPQRLAKYRAAFTSSRAKDDPTDAALILRYLRQERDGLRRWQPDDPATRELGLLVEGRRHLVAQRTALTNQLQAQLKIHFPQTLTWVGDALHGPLALDFLTKWPDLASLQRAKPATVRAFLYAHRVRGDRIEPVLAQIATAAPLTTDPAVLAAGSLLVQALVPIVRPLNRGIAAYDQRIAQLFAAHPDAPLFESLPGAGKALAPRLLVALGTDRQRFATAAEVQTYTGIAPVTERSGKSCQVHRRWACAKFLRQSFHEWAQHSLGFSGWAKAYYDLQRARGHKHHASVRSLAFKWIRVLFACWKQRQPYDEARYLAVLRQRGSALLDHLPAAA